MRILLRKLSTSFFTCTTPLLEQLSLSVVTVRVSNHKVTLKAVSSPFATMEARAPLSSETAWQQLQEYYNKNKNEINLQKLFAADPDRFKKFRYFKKLNLINLNFVMSLLSFTL